MTAPIIGSEREITVHCIYPPIPVRAFDYVACWADADPGDPVGHGASEADARAAFDAAVLEAQADEYWRDATASGQSDTWGGRPA